MGQLVCNLFGVLVFLFYVETVHAAKILIVTDQSTQKKAKELKKVLETTPPFSVMKDLTVVIRSLPKNSVTCTQPLEDQQEVASQPGETTKTKEDPKDSHKAEPPVPS